MKLFTLLPFMDEEEIKELATKIITKEVKGVPLVTLYPFLNREDLEEIFEQLLKEGNTKQLYSALPFLSRKSINKFYDRVKAGEVKDFKESALLPFLDKSKIKELFNDLVKKAETEPDADYEEDELSDMISDAIGETLDEV